jgi:hypothetical protein
VKILLDTRVWGKATEELSAADHNVIWLGMFPHTWEFTALHTIAAFALNCASLSKEQRRVFYSLLGDGPN